MAAADTARAPLLVLGLGNILLHDDGFGIRLVRMLAREYAEDEGVECVDGGTQGIALLGCLSGRDAVLLLDAYQLGEAPGTLRFSLDPMSVRARRGVGAHGGNASELLAAASLIGSLPSKTRLLGVEPSKLTMGIGLTSPVEARLPEACALACRLVESLRSDSPPVEEVHSHA